MCIGEAKTFNLHSDFGWFKYLFCIVCCLYSSFAIANPHNKHFIKFNVENGFPSNNVYNVLRDHNGYLWFATENGVVKYNGYTTKVFNTNDGLPVNDVWYLFEDNRGRIWLHSHAYEIGYIENDKYVTAVRNPDQTNHPDYITNIEDFVLFLHRRPNGFQLVIYQDTVVASIPLARLFPFSIRTLSIDKNARMRIFRKGGAAYAYNIFRNRIEYKCRFLQDPYPYLEHIHFKYLTNDLLYGARFKGNSLYNLNLADCSYAEIDKKALGLQNDEYIYVFYFQKDSIIVVTDSKIRIYSSDLKPLKTTIFKSISDKMNIVYYYQLHNNQAWYATSNAGAFAVCDHPDIFYNTNYPVDEDLRYVGKYRDDASLWWNKKNKQLIKIGDGYSTYSIPGAYGDVSSFSYTPEGCYMATTSGVYSMKDLNSEMFDISQYKTIVLDYPHGVEEDSTYVIRGNDSLRQNLLFGVAEIEQRSRDTIFLNTFYVIKHLVFSKDSLTINIIDQNRFTGMLGDAQNDLMWFYNNNRMMVYSPAKTISCTISDEILRLLGIKGIKRMALDEYSNLYIQENNRIVVFNIKTRTFTTLLPHVNLSEAHLQLNGNTILIAGPFGIVYGKSTGELAFGRFKAVSNDNSFYYHQLYRFETNGKRLFLYTDKGVLQTTLAELQHNDNAVMPSSSNFFRVPVKFADTRMAERGDTVFINHGTVSPKLTFNAVNFYGNGTVDYEYRISDKEYHGEWQKTSSNELLLGNMVPDTYYKLEYFARDNFWKSRTQVKYIYIEPMWYQTRTWNKVFWISGITFVVLFLLMTVFITRYFVARSTEKKRSLVDMELRALYSQINPHFIFNTLGTALFFISKKRYEEAYSHVSRFSKLLRTYLTSSRMRYITLADEIAMLQNYIQLQQIRFEEKFDYNIEVDNKVPVHSVQIPTLLLQPLVENAINHGLFHKPSAGMLLLKFLQGRSSNELICIIDDNGVGRQKAKEIKKESSIKYESYGTDLTRELIAIFKKYEDMNIYLEYIDKTGDESGTIVKLTIRNLKYVT